MWPYFKINYEITFGHIYIHRPDSKVLVSRRQLVWFFSFSFGHACSMKKFLCQGSNPNHSSDLSHHSDNARSLTSYQGTSNFPLFVVEIIYLMEIILMT